MPLSEISSKDLKAYYWKLFSTLPKEEANLLCKLVQTMDLTSGNIGFSISINRLRLRKQLSRQKIRDNKKHFLKGLLAGPSLDYFEAVSKNVRLSTLEKAELPCDNAILFLSRTRENGKPRTLMELVNIYESKSNQTNFYCAFVTSNAGCCDYALVGERETLDALAKIPKAVY